MARARAVAGSGAANLIADMLKANGVTGPVPTRQCPCSIEYLVENALRSICSKRTGRVTIDAGTNMFPGFQYPHLHKTRGDGAGGGGK